MQNNTENWEEILKYKPWLWPDCKCNNAKNNNEIKKIVIDWWAEHIIKYIKARPKEVDKNCYCEYFMSLCSQNKLPEEIHSDERIIRAIKCVYKRNNNTQK